MRTFPDEISPFQSNYKLREKIRDNFLINPEKKKRAPYNDNHSAVKRMIKNKIWYKLNCTECPSSETFGMAYKVNRNAIPDTEPEDNINTIFLISDGCRIHHNDRAKEEEKQLNV